jgi:hypothetical protein
MAAQQSRFMTYACSGLATLLPFRTSTGLPWNSLVVTPPAWLPNSPSGGGGGSTQSMLDWTDEQWEAIRPKKK